MSTQIQEERKSRLLGFKKMLLGANLYLEASVELPNGYVISDYFSERIWDFNIYLKNIVAKKTEVDNLLNEMVEKIQERYNQLIASAHYIEFAASSRVELELRFIIQNCLERIHSLLTQ